MAGTEIPGMFYDAAKKRYFKIAHPASGGEYTLSAIEKRRKREKEDQEALIRDLARKGNLESRRRLQVKDSQALGIRHVLELGSRSWQEKFFYKRVSSKHKDNVRMPNIIKKIAFDPVSRRLFTAFHRCIASTYLDPGSDLISTHSAMLIAPLQSPPTSLTFESGTLLGTTQGGPGHPAEVFIRTEYGGKIARKDGTLWCSAVQPGQTQFAAAGTSILLYDSNSGPETRRDVNLKGDTDAMTMDFLDANIIAFGCRNGTVQLLDIRTKTTEVVSRFTHEKDQSLARIHKSKEPLGIAKVKALNMHQLMVSGLESTLRLYDLRFMKKKEHRALVNYSGHKNQEHLDINSMSICDNLIYVAQENRGIGVWHLDGDFLGIKETENQVDDMLHPCMHPGEHDTMWTMSRGVLDEWKFS